MTTKLLYSILGGIGGIIAMSNIADYARGKKQQKEQEKRLEIARAQSKQMDEALLAQEMDIQNRVNRLLTF